MLPECLVVQNLPRRVRAIFQRSNNSAKSKRVPHAPFVQARTSAIRPLVHSALPVRKQHLQVRPAVLQAPALQRSSKEASWCVCKTVCDSGQLYLGHQMVTNRLPNLGSRPVVFSHLSRENPKRHELTLSSVEESRDDTSCSVAPPLFHPVSSTRQDRCHVVHHRELLLQPWTLAASAVAAAAATAACFLRFLSRRSQVRRIECQSKTGLLQPLQ
mmetsp:Transcript_101485/g.291224  ORF Transcript_101485/g.291224 Transcript_101485/m.291224 type:complete len:215 (-) Transcript_101485:70-714(-)